MNSKLVEAAQLVVDRWETGDLATAVRGLADILSGLTGIVRFVDNGDGSVTDNRTGIVWAKNANLTDGPSSWDNAMAFVGKINADKYLGFSDWRLPNVVELESLIDKSTFNPALPSGHPFTSVQSLNVLYWSSSTGAYGPGYAWAISMYSGYMDSYPNTYKGYVWPVRGEQQAC